MESDIGPVVSSIESVSTIAVDLETSGLSPLDSKILLCQIGTPDDQWVINVASCPIDPILPYLTSNKWKKIIHNAKFESKFFQYYHHTKINNIWDAYIAEQLLFPDLFKNGLDDLALKYLGVVLDKSVRKSFTTQKKMVFTEKQINYAAKDTEVLFGIMETQIGQVKEFGLEKIVEVEFDLVGVVANMENVGIPIDAPLWKSKIKHFEDLHEQSRLSMSEIFFSSGKIDEQLGMFGRADALNLNSPKQIKEAFHKIGIDVDKTNERELQKVKHPAAQELLAYRGYQKILSSYGSSFLDKIHPFDGRLHPDFQQIGAETGRFSCREPNVQQIPEEFHECIHLDGYSVITADYSQIELRILAQLSDDEKLIKAFRSGEDLHKATASMMFGVPLASVSKAERFAAKTLNFMIAYGGGIEKLMDMLNAEAKKTGSPQVNFAQARSLKTRYQKTYQTMTNWLAETGNKAYRESVSTTMLGRRRTYRRPDINTMSEKDFEGQVASIKRRGANMAVQGTCADIVKLAMANVYNELNDSGFRANIILQVHDEIAVLAPKREAEGIKRVLEETMRRTAEEIITKVPVQCDAVVNDVWKK